MAIRITIGIMLLHSGPGLTLWQCTYQLGKTFFYATGGRWSLGFQFSFLHHWVYFITMFRMWFASSCLHPFSKSKVSIVDSVALVFPHCPHPLFPTQCYTNQICHIQNCLQGLYIKQHSRALNSELHFRVKVVRGKKDNLLIRLKTSYSNLHF